MRSWFDTFVRWVRQEPPTATPPRPYRRVVKRYPITPDEYGLMVERVDLECGHTIDLVHHRRAEIPCPDCPPPAPPAKSGNWR